MARVWDEESGGIRRDVPILNLLSPVAAALAHRLARVQRLEACHLN
jgi:hypothetical protein